MRILFVAISISAIVVAMLGSTNQGSAQESLIIRPGGSPAHKVFTGFPSPIIAHTDNAKPVELHVVVRDDSDSAFESGGRR